MKAKRWRAALLLALLGLVLSLAAMSDGLKAARISAPAFVAGAIAAFAALATLLAKRPLEILGALLARPLEKWQQDQDVRTSAPGWLVDQVDEIDVALALGIHRAIPLPPEADIGLLSSDLLELPEYVSRDIDEDLRSWIRARKADGGFVVLVGPAASGKTRCLYEALRAEVPDWNLIRTDDGQEINRRAAAGASLARSVLWLDDLPRFFGGDGITHSTVQYMLTRSGSPVLLAGTLWPEDLDRLLARPMTGEGKEINQNAIEILRMLGRPSVPLPRAIRFDVADRWTKPELTRAGLIAARDPRVELATRVAHGGKVTAVLTASEELIYNWTRADGDLAGQAIITAAVIARQCGHPELVTTQVLVAVALALLAGQKTAPAGSDWVEDALAWAVKPVTGRISALWAIRTSPGIVDGYAVSDILVQRWDDGPKQQITMAIEDDATWDLLVTHCSAAASVDVGLAAHGYSKPDTAEQAWLSAANHGRTDAMYLLGFLYRQQGNYSAGVRWLEEAAGRGDRTAMVELGRWHAEKGGRGEAERFLRMAAEDGDSFTIGELAFFLQGAGETKAESELLYRKGAELGDANAMANLGYVLAERNELAEAERWDRRGAELGHAGAMGNLGNLLRDRGELSEAQNYYRQAAERGYATVQADPDWLRPWPGEASDLGISNSMLELGDSLAQTDVAEAETWYRRLADLGDARGASGLVRILNGRGEREESEEWWRKSAELAYRNLQANSWSLLTAYGELGIQRHTEIIRSYARHLGAQGRAAEATTWYQRADAVGEPPSGQAA